MAKYVSNTLAELQNRISDLNKSGIFPFGYTAKMAEKSSISIETFQRALKGRSATMEAIRIIIEEAEKLSRTPKIKIPKRVINGLSVIELLDQSLLPAGYSEIAAERAGVNPATVRNFIRNQKLGRTTYASTQPISDALYEIAAMNEEWELKCRAEAILKKIA